MDYMKTSTGTPGNFRAIAQQDVNRPATDRSQAENANPYWSQRCLLLIVFLSPCASRCATELPIMVLSRGGAENTFNHDHQKVMNHIGAHNVCRSSALRAKSTGKITVEDSDR
jgi:hypothetical protein